MCMHWTSCLCWRETKTPSVFIAVFAMVTSLMQVILAIAVFTSMPTVNMNLATNPLYIMLAVADFFVVLFSIIMLIGLERANGCNRWSTVCWAIWVFIYILYESSINIYFFSLAFRNPPSPSYMYPKGILVVFVIYWIFKEIILFIGWSYIVSHLCYGYGSEVSYADPTVQVIGKAPGCGCGGGGGGGGVTPVQLRPAIASFDVVRPSSGCQVYSSNCGKGGGCQQYGQGQGNIYSPTRYI